MAQKSQGKFGLPSIILLGVNMVIGTGIFLMPGKAYSIIGTPIILVYVLLIAVVMSIALCFAEAASMFKKSGGAYVYTREAFGDFAGFEVGFMRWVVSMIAWATMAVGLATACSAIWPEASNPNIRNTIAISIIAVLSIANLIGVNLVKYINNISTVGKMIPLVIVAVLGVFFIKPGNFTNSLDVQVDIKSISQAAILIFYAFTGFENLGIPAGDMENPEKNKDVRTHRHCYCNNWYSYFNSWH